MSRSTFLSHEIPDASNCIACRATFMNKVYMPQYVRRSSPTMSEDARVVHIACHASIPVLLGMPRL
jgi:hypothetical protein